MLRHGIILAGDRRFIKLDYETPKRNNSNFRIGFLCGIICSIFLVFAGLGGQYLYENVIARIYQSSQGNQIDDTIYDSVINSRSSQKIAAIEEIIRDNYYHADDLTNEELENGLYRGLIAALSDPYAAYYTAEELALARANIEGVFFGIGAMLSFDEDKQMAVISGIIEGGSADESDLREGDYIVKVDDVEVIGYQSSEVVALVRGQENTMVSLTIYREGVDDYIVFDLIRKRMNERSSINYGLTEDLNIGYIQIAKFDTATVDQFMEALEELKDRGILGLIIDLRSNPGGNLTSVNTIARQILPQGLITYTEDSRGERVEHTCDGKNELDIPLIVLVNQYSASASEILAGAIQDHQKGTIIGMATYGKGEVQQILNLSDGTAIKLTISTYFTPLGRSLGGTGITPDIEIELDRDAYYEQGHDSQLEKAIEVLKGKIY
jgi:carboxyl-terminal processing protease